jgi:glucose-1-phosphatase
MLLKAVIFDVGGVLVRTQDQQLRRQWERRLGLAPGEAAEIVFGGESGRAVQLGRISDAEHWSWIQSRLALGDEDLSDFRRDFFVRDHLDQSLLAYIGRLRAHYTVGLLSNASAGARQLLAQEYPILDAFDCVTISGEEGVMKPETAIYRIALGRAGARPEEALFVDDSLENVEAARSIGMQAVHFRKPRAARRELVALTGIW